MSDNERPTLCVECGIDVSIDEDGCCRSCGNGAVGTWLDHHPHLARLTLTEGDKERMAWLANELRSDDFEYMRTMGIDELLDRLLASGTGEP